MMATGNIKKFSDLFAPFDENYALDLAEKMMNQNKQPAKEDEFLSSNNMILPIGLDSSELENIQD